MAEDGDRPTDDELLDLVAGRADAATAERVRRAAEADPGIAADLALMRGARTAFASSEAERTPGALGWARLSRALDAEAALPARRRPALWQIAASAAAAVVVWQIVAVPFLTGRAPVQPGYVTVTEPPAGAPTLTVAFAPGTTEAELAALMRETGADIAGPPSALGLWRLAFDDEAARDGALELLRASPVVESVQAD